MIAKSERARHYHPTERSIHGRAPDDAGELVIPPEVAAIGRQVAIHLAGRQFDVAVAVVEEARSAHEREAITPDTLVDVPLDRLGLPTKVCGLLFDDGYRTADDVACASDAQLRQIQQGGAAVVRQIRRAVDKWVDRILQAQDGAQETAGQECKPGLAACLAPSRTPLTAVCYRDTWPTATAPRPLAGHYPRLTFTHTGADHSLFPSAGGAWRSDRTRPASRPNR